MQGWGEIRTSSSMFAHFQQIKIYPFVFLFFIIFSNCHIYLQINKSTFTLIILCKLRRRSSPILTANENIEIWKFTLPFRIKDYTLVVDLYLYFKIDDFVFWFLFPPISTSYERIDMEIDIHAVLIVEENLYLAV